jgi:hypothetical protein
MDTAKLKGLPVSPIKWGCLVRSSSEALEGLKAVAMSSDGLKEGIALPS